MKLTKKQMTLAIRRYARKHGYSASTVRSATILRLAAIKEFKENG